jgi:hypothetical protein
LLGLAPKLKLAYAICCGICLGFACPVTARCGSDSQLQAETKAAYQLFHNGQAHQAAKAIRDLATRSTDLKDKVLLLRDLVEVCATAMEWPCAVQAEIEAFNFANSEQSLKPIIPELYSYLIEDLIWEQNDERVESFLQQGGVRSLIFANPPVAAELHLALHTYYIRKTNYREAEDAISAAILGLLLVDPANKYAISKILVSLLEAFIESQDIVSALTLSDLVEQYLATNLNHNGLIWARYRSLTAELLAFIGANKLAISALREADVLNRRLEINEGVKAYRLAVSNSLASLAALLDNRLDDAANIHQQHPFIARRQEILGNAEFRTIQEFYFAVSDVLVPLARGQKPDSAWKALFQKRMFFENDDFNSKQVAPYRDFALGLLALSEDDPTAADLLISASKQRVALFGTNLQRKFEGFQLASSIDHVMLAVGLSAAAKRGHPEDHDLLLQGSEMLLRDIRHQLSDFAVLIGSQNDERSRRDAQSYNLLSRQKREWEFQRIRELLSGAVQFNKGEIIMRRLNANGAVEWTKRFLDLPGFNLYDVVIFKHEIFAVASPPAWGRQGVQQHLLLKLSWDGSEIGRKAISAPDGSFVIGEKALLSQFGNKLAVAINSQESPHLDTTRPGAFGAGAWCKGTLSLILLEIDPTTLSTGRNIAIPGLQGHTLRGTQRRILIGGEARSGCDQGSTAALLEVKQDFGAKMFWRDDDAFPSQVRAIREGGGGVQLAIRRERPLGVHSPKTNDPFGYSRRWADNDNSIYEYSVVSIDEQGNTMGQANSEFGLSAFIQGSVEQHGKMILYGTIADRPAMSMSSAN